MMPPPKKLNLPKPYYQDEWVTIYHGDSNELVKKINSIQLVFADPPYGVGLSENSNIGKQKYKSFIDSEENVRNTIIPVIKQCIDKFQRVVVTPGTRMMFDYPRPTEVGSIFFPAGAGFSRWGFTCSQPILYYGKDPYSKSKKPNSFKSTELSDKNGHPCPKPQDMMQWFIQRASIDGETVLDPFMGSGTTGRACKNLRRKFIGIEIEESYCEIAARQMQQEVLL